MLDLIFLESCIYMDGFLGDFSSQASHLGIEKPIPP
jgi:hypothetical protein